MRVSIQPAPNKPNTKQSQAMGSNTKAGVPGGSRLELAGGWRGGDDAGKQGWRAGQRMRLGRGQGLETVVMLLACLLLVCTGESK